MWVSNDTKTTIFAITDTKIHVSVVTLSIQDNAKLLQHFPTVGKKDYNFMIDEQNVFNQPVKNDLRTYDNIGKSEIGQGDDCSTGFLLDYNYCNKYYKMVVIDLSNNNKHMMLI